MATVPVFVKKYFWEVDADELDPQKNSEYIIGRILEYGDTEAARWMFQAFDTRAVKEALLKKRGFSRITANFWRVFFNLSKKDISCLRKPYPKSQKTHWPY